MKKTLLGLVAAFALFSFAAPARAEGEAPAGDKAADGAKKEKKAKKGKKDKAAEGAAGETAPPAGGDAAKK
jgi:hypothetical protein